MYLLWKVVKPARAGKIDKFNEPEQVNQYTITNRTLGRGAQGTVKLAKDSTKVYVLPLPYTGHQDSVL
jgi:hypothetical protein